MFLLQGIPELSGVFALSLALAKVPLRWGRIVAVGTVLAVIMFFIRTSSFAAGFHTVAVLLLVVISITSATRVPPTKAFVVVLLSIIFLGFLELIITEGLFTLLELELQQVMLNHYSLWKLLTLPQAAIMILVSLLVPRFMKPEQEVWKI